MRPIRARKPFPQVGQKWVGVVLEVAPAGSVGGKRFPGLSANVEVF